jgi:hypothetical protein
MQQQVLKIFVKQYNFFFKYVLAGTTKTYYFVLSPNQTLGDDGILSNSASITSLEQAVNIFFNIRIHKFIYIL